MEYPRQRSGRVWSLDAAKPPSFWDPQWEGGPARPLCLPSNSAGAVVTLATSLKIYKADPVLRSGDPVSSCVMSVQSLAMRLPICGFCADCNGCNCLWVSADPLLTAQGPIRTMDSHACVCMCNSLGRGKNNIKEGDPHGSRTPVVAIKNQASAQCKLPVCNTLGLVLRRARAY